MDVPQARVERAEPPVPKAVPKARPPESEDSEEAALGIEHERRGRAYERPFASHIECPVCEALLDATGSALRSLCCEGCGHILQCEEVMALRQREHARTSRYS